MRSKIPVVVVVAVLAASGAWFYLTPYRVYERMALAARSGDAAGLAQCVDMPALRESMKANVNARLTAEMARHGNGDPAAALGAAFASALVNPMVEALLTPESLATLIRNGLPPAGDAAAGGATTAATVSKRYEDYARFVVTVRRGGGESAPVVFTFHRHGLATWKLAALGLPP
jgi:hypothetical protein